METAIQLSEVTKQYSAKKAVDHISFTIGKGEIVSILGPNGAGKTTIISMMLGLKKPTSGSVEILGSSPSDRKVKEEIGAMLQEVSVMDAVKVSELIHLFRSYYDKSLPYENLLTLSGLEKDAGIMATSLSGGQKRRLGFALAMAGDPSVLFLDEPTVGMDVTSRTAFWETIRSLKDAGKTIILTTHYLEEADRLSDRIIMMNHGKIVADGTPEEIKNRLTVKYVSVSADASLELDVFQTIPGVTEVERDGDHIKIYGDDTDAILIHLVRQNLAVRDFDIHKGDLDEAFSNLMKEGESDDASLSSTV
ncbi:ABC transporter ATP-binding protein [Thermoactinomyces sp. DSM 45892]|uniref:ABC transporter ATP-binding protein n=1 Tax=Thermoactinomyces sp. DSM 45892 TaxID=1882753 RepID=UPI00089AE9FB|nr:ABC transporter ATP-binding protein [Thermoactinomyces sp. DSM 45892]SDY12082.1 ABC-2 type transport system ATP-binding protein [Thermoactinomyces sp. DSM 45892]